MACLGLIPIQLADCGELVKDAELLSSDGITIDNGLSHKFLPCLSLDMGVTMCEAEQVCCKYNRGLKGTNDQYRYSIYVLNDE